MLSRVTSVFVAAALCCPLAGQPKTFQALVRTDFIPRDSTTADTSITVQFNRDALQFREREGIAEAVVNLTVRISTTSGRSRGRVIEEVLEVRGAAEQIPALQTGSMIYNTTVALDPGSYRVTVAATDVVSGAATTSEQEFNVPQFRADAFSSSSLILADLLERIPTRSTGQFVIGGTKVRPRMDATFRRDGTLGVYLQVLHPQIDATVTYEILRSGSGERVLEFSEFLGGGAEPWVIEKKLKLDTMIPGDYTLRVKVAGGTQLIAPSAEFKVI